MKNNVFTAKNVWRDGLIMDLAPDNTQNTVLTSALNATLITFNGNELSLQNDMGNGRVETAMLPEGYIPVGAAELGGIIYIAAHNPLNGQSLLGSFPSPERNLAKEEINDDVVTLSGLDFLGYTIDIGASWNNIKEKLGYVSYLKDEDNNYPYYNVNIFNEYSGKEKEQIINLSINDYRNLELLKYNPILTTLIKKIDLGMPKLNPGDKFYVGADNIQLEGSTIWNGLTGYINLYLASITNDNKIIPLELEKKKETNHVIGISPTDISNNNDLDAYREIVNNTFDIYNIKQSGKIYVIAELVVIDEFNYSYDIIDTDIVFTFDWSSKFGEVNPDHIKLTITDEDGTIRTTTNNGIYEYKGYSDKNGIVSITATPVMPFGELPHLTLTKNLDLDKINNDYYNLSLWQYYKNEDNSITLNLTTDFYPKEGFKFTEFSLNFINYENSSTVNRKITTSTNGTSTISIKPTDSTTLSLDSFYKVEITVSVEKKEVKPGESNPSITKTVSNSFYLYTSDIFNGFYSNNGYIKDGIIYSTKVSNFSVIDYTYGYKDGNKWTYPLQIPVTISNTFNQVKTPTFTHSYNLSEVITETEIPLISTDNMTGKYSYSINSTISTKEGLFNIKGTVKDIKIKNCPISYTISDELSDINIYKVTLDNVNHNSKNLTFDLQVIKGTKLETEYLPTTLYKFTNSVYNEELKKLLWLKVNKIENSITTWKVGYFDFSKNEFIEGGTKTNEELLDYIKNNNIYINNDLIIPFIIGYDDIWATPMYNTIYNTSCKYSNKLYFSTVRLTIDANPVSSYKEDEPVTISYAIINGEDLIFTNNIALLDGKSKNILYEYVYSKFYRTSIELSINDMYRNIYKHTLTESIYAYKGDNPCDLTHNIIVSPTIDFIYDYTVTINGINLNFSINNLNIKPLETITTDKINIEINNNDLKNAIEEKLGKAMYCDFNGTKYITNNLTTTTKVYIDIDKVPKPMDKYFKWTKIFKELSNNLEYSCKASWMEDLSLGKIYLNTILENDGYFLLDNKHKITDLSINIKIKRTGFNNIPLLGSLYVTCLLGGNTLTSNEYISQENINLGPVPTAELESESFDQTFTFNVDNINKFNSSLLEVEIPTLNAPTSDSGIIIQFTINIKLENIYDVIKSNIGEYFSRDGFGSEIPKPTFYFSPEKNYDLRTEAYEFKIIDNKLYYAENS